MTRLVWLQLELVATSLDLSWPPNSPLSPRPINTIKWISKEVLSSPCHRWRSPALDTIYAPILSSPRFLQITFPQLRMTAVTLAPFTKPISFPEAAILMYSDGGSLVTEALGTRLQWNQSQDCFSTHVTINYQFFFAHGKWVPITYFPIFDTIQYVFPRLWPFTQGVFPHLAPLDRLTGYMFSRAFYYSLTGYKCFPALFTIAWLATCFPALVTIAWSLTSYALFVILYPVASFPAPFIIAWLVTCFPAHFTMVYPITRFPAIFTIG